MLISTCCSKSSRIVLDARGPSKACALLLLAWGVFLGGCTTIVDATHVNTYAPSDNAEDEDAQIDTDENGNWLVVWASKHPLGSLGGDWDVYRSYSRSNGQLWTNASPVNQSAATDGVTGDVSPALAISTKGTTVAIWSSLNDYGGTVGTDEDIWVSRNADLVAGGWSIAKPLHQGAAKSDGKFDLDTYPSIATDSKGLWVAVWVKSDLNESDILTSHSADDGKTWSQPKLLNAEMGGAEKYFEYRPRITTDGKGTWIVAWSRDVQFASKEQVLISVSKNGGKSWSASKQINKYALGGWPSIAHDSKSTWLIAWPSVVNVATGALDQGRNIHVSRSTNNGASWSAPAYLNADWNAKGLGIAIPTNDAPDIASDGKGNWVAVWDLWQGTSPMAPDIRVAYSKDNGLSWTKPEYLNPKWSGTDLSESDARVATDRLGNWVVIWKSAAHIKGNTSPDTDIRVTRFEYPKP